MDLTTEDLERLKKMIANFKKENPEATFNDFLRLLKGMSFCMFVVDGKVTVKLPHYESKYPPSYHYLKNLFKEET